MSRSAVGLAVKNVAAKRAEAEEEEEEAAAEAEADTAAVGRASPSKRFAPNAVRRQRYRSNRHRVGRSIAAIASVRSATAARRAILQLWNPRTMIAGILYV